jgi:hypothetical protein
MRAESLVGLEASAVGAGVAAGGATVAKPLAVSALAASTASGSAILGKPLGGAAFAGLNAAAAASVSKFLAGAATGGATATGVMPSSNYPALGSLAFYANSGVDDYARLLSLPPDFGTGEFTFELRIKLDETYPVGTAGGTSTTNWSSADPTRYTSSSWWYPGNFLLDGHNNSNPAQGTFSLQVIGGGRLRWDFGDNSPSLTDGMGRLWAVQPVPASSAASLLDDKWHHVALVRRWSGASSATLEMWIDGVLIASETTNVRTNMQTYWAAWAGYGGGIQNGWLLGAEKFSAGGGAYWDDYKGQVSYLRFYSRAKTATELANDWARDSTQGETGLVGLFQIGALAANRTYDTLRPAAYIECFPQAGAARSTEIPIAAVVPGIAFTRGAAASVDLVSGARTGTVTPAAGAYVAGFDPAQHVVQLAGDSAALPSGVTLSPTGVLAYNGTGTGALTTNNVRIAIAQSAEADWLARSTAAGVLMANRFDTIAQAAGGSTANDGWSRSGGGVTGWSTLVAADTSVRCSGAQALRLNMLNAAADNAGQYLLTYPVQGQGSEFYVQFRWRCTAEFRNPTAGSGGAKVSILHYADDSNADLEVTIQDQYHRNNFQAYSQGGSYNYEKTVSGTLYVNQGADPLPSGAGYNCPYNASYATDPRCAGIPVNTWVTILIRIRVGTWGASNSDVEMWMALPGQGYKQFINFKNSPLVNAAPVYPGFNRITLTPYRTGSSQAPGGSVWYDEVIVSSQFIPAPAALALGG